MPGLISTGPVAKDIYKMKIKGRKGHVQLRPMICRGPFGVAESTLLHGAIEKDGKLYPRDAASRAQDNRTTLRAQPTRRRHEPIN